ncbi:MAG: DUF4145 domain-containing protein [Lachnospiraceae bacterium]|jgi:uncharacterized protein YgiM (DUF1202 family)|nr:DUF4145 domain-containing protein [Lachnospiraceae bacterium]MCI8961167.1 DUF4145 domain-containing protein [Lachnospiraceae bacterium]
MADSGAASGWSRIQAGVKDTERLIGHKEYNAAMMKARQTLEFMVNLLAERACIVEGGDLKDNIDTLYKNRWITRETCEAYHRIRMLGNKAAHEGDNSGQNAGQCFQLLDQEARILKGDLRSSRSPSRTARSRSSSGSPRRAPARQGRGKSGGRRPPRPSLYDILRLLAPVLFIILLVLIIKLVKPAPSPEPSVPAETTPAAETMVPATEPETTGAPDGTEPVQVTYRTTSRLNVRPQPSTDGEPIGQLNPGASIAYIRAYNDEWAVIQYGDREAYVASRYLTTE